MFVAPTFREKQTYFEMTRYFNMYANAVSEMSDICHW
jgi:hypothetical protein